MNKHDKVTIFSTPSPCNYETNLSERKKKAVLNRENNASALYFSKNYTLYI